MGNKKDGGSPEYQPVGDTNEFQALQREKKVANVGFAYQVVKALDLLDLTGIFIMSGNDVFKLLFEHLARYIMLPVAAVSTIIFSVFSWITAYLTQDKDLKGFRHQSTLSLRNQHEFFTGI